jgi:hypothetical protein
MQLYYYKAHEGHERRYLYRGRILQSYVLFWVIMFIFEICVRENAKLMEGFETGRPLYSTIDRYIFDLLWKGYKLKEYAAIMGGRGIGKLYH